MSPLRLVPVLVALTAPVARAGEVVFVTADSPLEKAFATELRLASADLVLHPQAPDPEWSTATAQAQTEVVRAWIDGAEADAAIWLTEPAELHVHVPSADRDLVVSVRAATDQPAAELALVALQHLEELGWSTPAPAPAPTPQPLKTPPSAPPKAPPRPTGSVAGAVDVGGYLGPGPAPGPQLGGRLRAGWDRGPVVPWVDGGVRLGVADATRLEVRGDLELAGTVGLWARSHRVGPTVGLRIARRSLSWVDGNRRSDAWWAPALVPGLRAEPGAGPVRPLLQAELPVGLRSRQWLDGDTVQMQLSPVQFSVSAGLVWTRRVPG